MSENTSRNLIFFLHAFQSWFFTNRAKTENCDVEQLRLFLALFFSNTSAYQIKSMSIRDVAYRLKKINDI